MGFQKNRATYLLLGILLFGFFIRIWNLSGPDMATDDTLYSLRSIGYVDYVASTNKQSTPVTWFSEPQWWQGLSFHDAPPLVFAVQWLFFTIGGDTTVTARLPFVFAGTLAIYAVYLLGKYIGGVRVGLVASATLALMNYSTWLSRIGYLDGFLILWIPLSLYFFLKVKDRPVNYIWWAICVAAGLLTKYTFVFMGPVFLIMLLWRRRAAFRNKWFYIGVSIFFVLVAPVIIYNVMMWKTRGHLDAGLSAFLGQAPEDFKGLTRTVGRDFSFVSPFRSVRDNTSVGVQMLIILSVCVALYKIIREKNYSEAHISIGLGIVWALLMLIITGGSDWFGAVLIPYIALSVGIGSMWLWDIVRKRGKIIFSIAVGVVALWELLFTIQSQWLAQPFLHSRLAVAVNRPSFVGYNAVENYTNNFYLQFSGVSNVVIFTAEPQLAAFQKERILHRLSAQPNAPRQTHLLVFDDRMDWFPWVWIFERRRLYDAAPIHSITQFIDYLRSNGGALYAQLGFKDATIIVAEPALLQGKDFKDDFRTLFIAELKKTAQPIDAIKNTRGEIIGEVFRLSIK